MRCTGHVAQFGREEKFTQGFGGETLERLPERPWPIQNNNITQILKKQDERARLNYSGSGPAEILGLW
jgi:hypothetical protein